MIPQDTIPNLAYIPTPRSMAPFIRQIIAERASQDAKWGQQNHDNRKWAAILMEEIGEVARAVLESEQGQQNADSVNLREELVQVAAVAMAWLECLERNKPDPANPNGMYPLDPEYLASIHRPKRGPFPVRLAEPNLYVHRSPSRRDVATLMMNREAA